MDLKTVGVMLGGVGAVMGLVYVRSKMSGSLAEDEAGGREIWGRGADRRGAQSGGSLSLAEKSRRSVLMGRALKAYKDARSMSDESWKVIEDREKFRTRSNLEQARLLESDRVAVKRLDAAEEDVIDVFRSATPEEREEMIREYEALREVPQYYTSPPEIIEDPRGMMQRLADIRAGFERKVDPLEKRTGHRVPTSEREWRSYEELKAMLKAMHEKKD